MKANVKTKLIFLKVPSKQLDHKISFYYKKTKREKKTHVFNKIPAPGLFLELFFSLWTSNWNVIKIENL